VSSVRKENHPSDPAMRSMPSSSSASRLTWPGPLTAGGKCASTEQHLEEHPGLDGEEMEARAVPVRFCRYRGLGGPRPHLISPSPWCQRLLPLRPRAISLPIRPPIPRPLLPHTAAAGHACARGWQWVPITRVPIG
jgi:hypothetical protein